MALQGMVLVPTELWEKRCQAPSPLPVKKVLKSQNHSYNKWTQVSMHQDPYLKTEQIKREPIPIRIIETGCSKPKFKTKLRSKHIIGSLPLFNPLASAFKRLQSSFAYHNLFARHLNLCTWFLKNVNISGTKQD